MDLELKISMQKIEDQMLYYGCKDSQLLLEIKNAVVVVAFIFLKHNDLYGQGISSSQLWQVDSTSGQKQMTIFKIHGPRRN